VGPAFATLLDRSLRKDMSWKDSALSPAQVQRVQFVDDYTSHPDL
jgi:hypothetical protein